MNSQYLIDKNILGSALAFLEYNVFKLLKNYQIHPHGRQPCHENSIHMESSLYQFFLLDNQ